MKSWAAQVRALAASGKELYIYFNNDWEGLPYGMQSHLKGYWDWRAPPAPPTFISPRMTGCHLV